MKDQKNVAPENQSKHPINPAPAGEAAAGGTVIVPGLVQQMANLVSHLEPEVKFNLVKGVNSHNVLAFNTPDRMFILSWHDWDEMEETEVPWSSEDDRTD